MLNAVAELVAGGPRVEGAGAEYRAIVSAILQGVEMHYREPAVGADPDLDLLRGDESYAAGLTRLAQLGDLAAVAVLADVISLVAAAYAVDDSALADAVWEAGATAIGWGPSAAIDAAMQAAREGAENAGARLLAAAVERR